jgi:glutaredoxin 3
MEQREIVLYVRRRSLGSWRARRLLARKGCDFEVVDTTDDASRVTFKQLGRSVYTETVPYIFVDQRPVGGYADIRVLDRSGELECLVQGLRPHCSGDGA